MKEELANELTVMIDSLFPNADRQELKLKILMILTKYDVTKAETALTVYEGDVNEEMLKKFLYAKLAAGLSKRTLKYYNETNTKFFQTVNKPYYDITADDIRMYIAARTYKDKVTKTTANNERRNLSAFYAWLQKEEILLKNPMNKVDSLKVTKVKKKAFSLMEIEKIRDACRSKRENALVEILFSTWARVTEISEIKIEDIHTNHQIVHGKGDKEREVYLNAKAVLAIQNYLSERSDNNPYLFPRAKYAGNVVEMAKGKRRKFQCEWYRDPRLVHETDHADMGTIEGIVKNIGKRAGVQNVHPHRFRRTGATMALRSGMSLIQVSKLLGHENIGTTQIYLDVSDEELAQAHTKYVV